MTRVNISLPDLQYHLKKDSSSYKFEFKNCYEEFISLEDIFRESPSEDIARLRELVLFLASVVDRYKEYIKSFIDRLYSTLISKYFSMNIDMQNAYLSAFMRLRNKNLTTAIETLKLSFHMIRAQNKTVRKALRKFIIKDFQRTNQKSKCPKINSSAQEFLATLVEDSSPSVSREAVFILRELFNKQIWADAKTVNILTQACLVKFKKTFLPCLFFFLGKVRNDDESDDDSDDENLGNKIKHLQTGHRVGNKTNSRKKRLERNIENAKKKEESKAKKATNQEVNHLALNLIHDQQGFAEKLLKKMEKCTEKFEIKLLLLELLSRLIGLFKLSIINFYPALQKFLRPQQREVTHLLMYAAQASHDQVPPDVIQPLVRTIADNFVTERASAEAIAVGLNSIREICGRCPYAVDKDLLEDLVQYRSYRNKNVVSAARSIIRLYRSLNPTLLPANVRGKPTDEAMNVKETNEQIDVNKPMLQYAVDNIMSNVPGAEAIILKQLKKNKDKNLVLTPEDYDRIRKEAMQLASDVVFDDQDFERIKKHIEKQKTSLTARGGQKRKFLEKQQKRNEAAKQAETEGERSDSDNDSDDDSESSSSINNSSCSDDSSDSDSDGEVKKEKPHPDIVTHSSIIKLSKRLKMDKLSRIESVNDGREDREKFGFKVRRQNPHASTTNKEKTKKKTFSMIKHKVKSKGKLSIRDKQIRLRNHLTKLAKFTKK